MSRARGRSSTMSRGRRASSGRAFICIGSLSRRKNVQRLANAFEAIRRDGDTLTFVGEGEFRKSLDNRPPIRLTGQVEHDKLLS
jgi:glycosyltransferase involved in cell wall biosynthesis